MGGGGGGGKFPPPHSPPLAQVWSERLAFLPYSSNGEMRLSGYQYSERFSFLSETLTVGLQSESVDFKEKKADGGNSVGEIPSYPPRSQTAGDLTFWTAAVRLMLEILDRQSRPTHPPPHPNTVFVHSVSLYQLSVHLVRRNEGEGEGERSVFRPAHPRFP